MPAKMRIEFLSDGFNGILHDPGLDSMLASLARQKAQQLEQSANVPYAVEKKGFSSRSVYLVRPEGGEAQRVPGLDHETWINEVWPMVGGDKWRPHGG